MAIESNMNIAQSSQKLAIPTSYSSKRSTAGFLGVKDSLATASTPWQFGAQSSAAALASIKGFQKAVGGGTLSPAQVQASFRALPAEDQAKIKAAIYDANGKNDEGKGVGFGDHVIANLATEQRFIGLLNTALANILTGAAPLKGIDLVKKLVSGGSLMTAILNNTQATAEEIKEAFNLLSDADRNAIKGFLFELNNRNDEGKGVGFGDHVVDNLTEKKYFDLFKLAVNKAASTPVQNPQETPKAPSTPEVKNPEPIKTEPVSRNLLARCWSGFTGIFTGIFYGIRNAFATCFARAKGIFVRTPVVSAQSGFGDKLTELYKHISASNVDKEGVKKYFDAMFTDAQKQEIYGKIWEANNKNDGGNPNFGADAFKDNPASDVVKNAIQALIKAQPTTARK